MWVMLCEKQFIAIRCARLKLGVTFSPATCSASLANLYIRSYAFIYIVQAFHA